jgi:hypothetical protein
VNRKVLFIAWPTRTEVEGPCLSGDDVEDAPEDEVDPKRLSAFRTGDKRVSLSTFQNIATLLAPFV